MNSIIRYVLWIWFICIAGCRQMSADEKIKMFVDDPGNKIKQTIAIGDVGIVAKYLPPSYRSLFGREADSAHTQDEQFYYFNVKFSKKTTEKPAREKLMYLNFDLQNDFVLLVNDRDSIAPAICQKIENGFPGEYEYLMAFEKKEGEDGNDLALIYNDKIFSVGTVAFVYDKKDISRVPDTKMNELQ